MAERSRHMESLEREAERRDAQDRARLAVIDTWLVEWLDVLISQSEPLKHPYRRWAPEDLIEDLQGHRRAIAIEMARLSGPVVLGK